MRIKRSIITVILLMSIVMCSACGKNTDQVKNALLGTWEYSWDSLAGRCVDSYQFKLDGTVINDFSGANISHHEGSYTIEKDKIVCKWDDNSADSIFVYSLQGDSLYLEGASDDAGEGEEYRKK